MNLEYLDLIKNMNPDRRFVDNAHLGVMGATVREYYKTDKGIILYEFSNGGGDTTIVSEIPKE